MKLKDLEPGEMFRRPTGKYRYVVSNLRRYEGHTPDIYCYNLDGDSPGYWISGNQEFTRIPTLPGSETEESHNSFKEEAHNSFYMCYVEGERGPGMKHHRVESAGREAERLARNLGKRVYLLQAYCYAQYTPPTEAAVKWRKLVG